MADVAKKAAAPGGAVPTGVAGAVPPARKSLTPHRKVLATVTGAGIGAATSDLLVGGLADMFNGGHPIPLYLSHWIVVVVPVVLGGAAGYFTKRASDE